MKRLMLVGASGLVGQSVLRQALAHPQVQQLVAPTRCLLPPHAKLHNPVVDFDALAVDADWWAVDAVICTLGTTKKNPVRRPSFAVWTTTTRCGWHRSHSSMAPAPTR
jgi:uncharacterized protein YbjT (DUF2867 family)